MKSSRFFTIELQTVKVRVIFKVVLRVAVYRQSVHLCVKPKEGIVLQSRNTQNVKISIYNLWFWTYPCSSTHFRWIPVHEGRNFMFLVVLECMWKVFITLKYVLCIYPGRDAEHTIFTKVIITGYVRTIYKKYITNIPVSENRLEGHTQATSLCVIVFLLLIIQKSMIMNMLSEDIEKRP
jgi:hypothetical protein